MQGDLIAQATPTWIAVRYIITCISSSIHVLLTFARAWAAKGYCSRLVCRSVRFLGLWVYPHVFSRTVAAVDTKC